MMRKLICILFGHRDKEVWRHEKITEGIVVIKTIWECQCCGHTELTKEDGRVN